MNETNKIDFLVKLKQKKKRFHKLCNVKNLNKFFSSWKIN